jgi:aminoglycoside phosphotransferase (APT) family kinase protein
MEYQPASEEMKSKLPLDQMHNFFSAQQVEIILKFTDLCHQELSQPVREPRFVHGDFWTGNMISRPDSVEVIGLLDFSRCWLADPIVDMAKLSYAGTSLVKEVLTHYNDHYEPLDVDQCLLHALLHRGLFVLVQIIQTGDLQSYYKKLNWWVLEPWKQITQLGGIS